MERLTKRLDDSSVIVSGANINQHSRSYVRQIAERLADLEDVQEQGKLVILPVALGQQVWFNSYDGVRSGHISSRQQKADGSWKVRITDDESRGVFDLPISSLGTRFFLNPAEAKAKEI